MENKTNVNQDPRPQTKREIFASVFLKASACLLAFVLVYSTVFLAFTKAKRDSAFITAAYAQTNETASPNTQNTANPETAQPNASDADNASAPQNGSDMQTEEIVKLYNDSVNRVKKEATSLTRNYKHMESLSEYLELPSAIQSIGSAAMDQFVKGTDTAESWTSKEDMQLVFPVGGTDYSSHLTADMVQSAVCKDNGDTYSVELKLYDDKLTSPQKGEGYAGVFNTVTASTFSDINIPTVTFETVEVNGIRGSIVCTIDKQSGRVAEITFCNTDVLPLGVKVAFSNMNVQFALAVEENYSVQY